jgi:spore coat protein H
MTVRLWGGSLLLCALACGGGTQIQLVGIVPTVPANPVSTLNGQNPVSPAVPARPAWPRVQSRIPSWSIRFPPETAEVVYDMSQGRVYMPGEFEAEGQSWAVELRQRGDSARYHPKHSWKVKLPEEVRLHGQRKLNFMAAWLDAGYLTDVFANHLMQAAGAQAPNTEYVTLTVNGEFQGIYVQIEQVDSRFLEQHGLDEDGNVYRCGSRDCELKATPRAHYQDPFEKKTNEASPSGDLDSLIRDLSAVPEHQLEADLERHFDLDLDLRSMAVNALVSNYGIDDSGSYLVHDLRRDRWSYVPWDLNNGLMRYWRSEPLTQKPYVTRALPVFTVYDPETIKSYEWKQAKYGDAHRPFSVLNQRIWDRPALRNRVLDHMERLLDTVFRPEEANRFIDALSALLRPELPRDPFVDPEHARRAPGFLKEYVQGRAEFVRKTVALERRRGEGGVVIDAIEPPGKVTLYNRENRAVDLGGMTFTDELRREFKYTLPAGLSIPAGGTLLLSADGQVGLGPTHLPFVLSSSGGELGLFDGVSMAGALDVAYYPALKPGEAYQRTPRGSEDWNFR